MRPSKELPHTHSPQVVTRDLRRFPISMAPEVNDWAAIKRGDPVQKAPTASAGI